MLRVRLDSQAFQDALDRAADGALLRVTDRLQAEADQIAAAARERWPVGRERAGAERGRPHSRDLFEVYTRLSMDEVSVVVVNWADYAYKIKTDQNGLLWRSPWQELVRKPMRERAPEIAADLQEELARLGNRRG